MKRAWAAAAAVPLLVITACAKPDGAAAPPPATGSFDADEVVLRVESMGGFAPPDAFVGRLPMITLYGDGRLISEGPVPAVYPGPALPNLRLRALSEDQVDKLIDEAVGAGVGSATDLGQPPVADAPTTRFTVVTADGPKTLDAIALNETDDAAGGLTDEQRQTRKQLREFVDRLSATTGSAGKSYDAGKIAAIATPWAAGDKSVPAPPEVAWPGPALPGDPVGNGLDVGCVVASGDSVRTAVGVTPGGTAAAKANAATPWTSAGKRWTVRLRPLLPDERGCTDLTSTG
jgi:hypothetical protein